MGLVLSILSTYMFVCHMCLVPGEAREPLDGYLAGVRDAYEAPEGAGNRTWFLCKSGQ